MRGAVLLGLATFDGAAAVAVARLADAWWLAPPRQLVPETRFRLGQPLGLTELPPFAAGVVCAVVLIAALRRLRSRGRAFGATAALLGALYGLLTAVVTAAVVPLLGIPDPSPSAVLGQVVAGAALASSFGVGVALAYSPVIVPAGALLGLLNGGVVRWLGRAVAR